MQPTHCRPNKATRRAKAVCMLCNPTLLGLVSARCESLTNHRCLEHCERCSRLSFQARRRRAPATDRRRGKMPLEGSFFLRSFVASDGVSPFLANRCFSRPPNFSNPANRRFLRPSLQRLFRAAAHPTRCVARARARQICLPAGSELFSSGGRPCSYAACTANGTTRFRKGRALQFPRIRISWLYLQHACSAQNRFDITGARQPLRSAPGHGSAHCAAAQRDFFGCSWPAGDMLSTGHADLRWDLG